MGQRGSSQLRVICLGSLVVSAVLSLLAGCTSSPGDSRATDSNRSLGGSSVTSSPASGQVIGGAALARPGTQIGKGANVGAFPAVTIESFVVADGATGRILASRNAHQKLPPASTLKTLTALTVLPQLRLSDTYTAQAADISAEGSRVGLYAGSPYTYDDLMYAMFLPSANDAATALARARGSVSRTVTAMNREAQRLQARDTVAKNPTGLDAAGQVSSAYDLALLGREGLRNPDIARYAAAKRWRFPGRQPTGGARRSTFVITTENRLMLGGFPGVVGVKTGYTTNAQRTFIGAYRAQGHYILISMMRNREPTAVDARRLFEWGARNAARISEPVGVLVEPVAPAPSPDPPPVTPTPTSIPTPTLGVSATSTPGVSATSTPSVSATSSPSISSAGPAATSPPPTTDAPAPRRSISTAGWILIGLCVAVAAVLFWAGSVANGSLARRRVRRRYRR
ncbi:MAG TPA: D-alanyl-D-alanine carboxypeptidase [Actinobacteria bacterium]|nr:D-alanyl-D-alanine carboxypeptidase [Actinomycetota bacterium]